MCLYVYIYIYIYIYTYIYVVRQGGCVYLFVYTCVVLLSRAWGHVGSQDKIRKRAEGLNLNSESYFIRARIPERHASNLRNLQDLNPEVLESNSRWPVRNPDGAGGLAKYTPTVPVPTLEQMIERLLAAGFSQCNIADGGESRLGAWSMDCVWHALRQWHGVARRRTRMGVLGNRNYMKAAIKMAGDCGVELTHWTRRLGGVCPR